jgi:hypothetical protein
MDVPPVCISGLAKYRASANRARRTPDNIAVARIDTGDISVSNQAEEATSPAGSSLVLRQLRCS